MELGGKRYIKLYERRIFIPGWEHSNHFDSHNSIIYNENDKHYYIYVRDNHNNPPPIQRRVQYFKTADFLKITPCNIISITSGHPRHIYKFGVVHYPNNPHLYLALATIMSTTELSKKNEKKTRPLIYMRLMTYIIGIA